MPQPLPVESPSGWHQTGRITYLQGLNVIRRAMQVQLTENQTWYGETIDCQGLSIFGWGVINSSASPAAPAQTNMIFSPNSDFSTPPSNAWHSLTPPTPGNGAFLYTPSIILGRFARPMVKAGSTTGTYTFSIYWVFTP